jgi:hypothetical protein
VPRDFIPSRASNIHRLVKFGLDKSVGIVYLSGCPAHSHAGGQSKANDCPRNDGSVCSEDIDSQDLLVTAAANSCLEFAKASIGISLPTKGPQSPKNLLFQCFWFRGRDNFSGTLVHQLHDFVVHGLAESFSIFAGHGFGEAWKVGVIRLDCKNRWISH